MTEKGERNMTESFQRRWHPYPHRQQVIKKRTKMTISFLIVSLSLSLFLPSSSMIAYRFIVSLVFARLFFQGLNYKTDFLDNSIE
jgi:hypothetical protein